MTIYDKIAAIQDEVQNITKDAKNSHFGNTYATYENVLKVLTPIFRKHNLMVLHTFGTPLFESHMAVTTTLKGIGENKDELSTTLHIQTVRIDPQAAGSAITYAKRYSLLAMLGLGTEDDDANLGSGRTEKKTEPTRSEVDPNTCEHLNTTDHQVKKEGKNKDRWYKSCNDCKTNGYASFVGWINNPIGEKLTTNENGSVSWGKTEFSEPH